MQQQSTRRSGLTIFESGRDTFRQRRGEWLPIAEKSSAEGGWPVGELVYPVIHWGLWNSQRGYLPKTEVATTALIFGPKATLLSVLERQQESESCFFQWPVDIKS